MTIFFGILFMIGGIAYILYIIHVSMQRSATLQQIQTTRLTDAEKMLSRMEKTGFHRSYVELKGVAGCDAPPEAPFSGRAAAYYESRVFSVWANRPRIPNGRAPQPEKEIFHDISQAPVYVTDESGLKIYIDTKSLEGKIELTPSYDRFEPKDSIWFRRNWGKLLDRMEPEIKSPDFLGFRLKENVLLPGQPLYLLGELYRAQEKLYLGSASLSKKLSFVSCKSENHVLSDFRKQRLTGFVIGGIVVLIGLVLLFIR